MYLRPSPPKSTTSAKWSSKCLKINGKKSILRLWYIKTFYIVLIKLLIVKMGQICSQEPDWQHLLVFHENIFENLRHCWVVATWALRAGGEVECGGRDQGGIELGMTTWQDILENCGLGKKLQMNNPWASRYIQQKIYFQVRCPRDKLSYVELWNLKLP